MHRLRLKTDARRKDDVENTRDGGVYVGDLSDIKLTERQRTILNLIKESPTVSTKRMSEIMSEIIAVTPRTIERDLSILKSIGLLERKGRDNDGKWIIMKKI